MTLTQDTKTGKLSTTTIMARTDNPTKYPDKGGTPSTIDFNDSNKVPITNMIVYDDLTSPPHLF